MLHTFCEHTGMQLDTVEAQLSGPQIIEMAALLE